MQQTPARFTPSDNGITWLQHRCKPCSSEMLAHPLSSALLASLFCRKTRFFLEQAEQFSPVVLANDRRLTVEPIEPSRLRSERADRRCAAMTSRRTGYVAPCWPRSHRPMSCARTQKLEAAHLPNSEREHGTTDLLRPSDIGPCIPLVLRFQSMIVGAFKCRTTTRAVLRSTSTRVV